MATVVTAYYPLKKSKHSLTEYQHWIQNFCKFNCNLVVFTDAATAAQIKGWRGPNPTHFEIRAFDSFKMSSPSQMEFWNRQYEKDPEKAIHSPELYAIWAMKQECVRIVTDTNPFSSRWFVWCDIGIQRHAFLDAFYSRFPMKCEELCAPGRISALEVYPINPSLVELWSSRRPLQSPPHKDAIGGGCLAGDKAAWNSFGLAYEQMLTTFDKRGWFAGKDQHICLTMLIELTAPIRLYKSQQFARVSGIYWMSFPVILGGAALAEVDSRFEG